MAWTTPITWTVGQIIPAATLNTQIRDNLNYLNNYNIGGGKPASVIKRYTAGADYTTTSTSFVDVDATNVIITLVLGGSKVAWGATFAVSGALAHFDCILDSTTRYTGATNGFGAGTLGGGGSDERIVTIGGLWTGLSVGSHTFKLQWKLNTVGTALMAASSVSSGQAVILWAYEVG